MKSIGMIILGLVLGAVGVGGYMYLEVQSVTRQKLLIEGAHQAAQKAGKVLEEKAKYAESAKAAAEKTVQDAKAQIDKLMAEKTAADTAKGTAEASLAQLKPQLDDAIGKLTAAQNAQAAAEKLIHELRDQLTKADSAREAAEKALAEAKRQ